MKETESALRLSLLLPSLPPAHSSTRRTRWAAFTFHLSVAALLLNGCLHVCEYLSYGRLDMREHPCVFLYFVATVATLWGNERLLKAKASSRFLLSLACMMTGVGCGVSAAVMYYFLPAFRITLSAILISYVAFLVVLSLLMPLLIFSVLAFHAVAILRRIQEKHGARFAFGMISLSVATALLAALHLFSLPQPCESVRGGAFFPYYAGCH